MSRATVEAEPDRAAALMRAVWRAGALARPSPANVDHRRRARSAGAALSRRLAGDPRADAARSAGRRRARARGARAARRSSSSPAPRRFPWRSQALWIAEALARRTGADRAPLRAAARACFRTDLYRAVLGPIGADLPGASEKLEGALPTSDGGRLHARAGCCSGPTASTTGGFSTHRWRRRCCSNRADALLHAHCAVRITRVAFADCCCGARRSRIGWVIGSTVSRASFRPEAGAPGQRRPILLRQRRVDRAAFLFRAGVPAAGPQQQPTEDSHAPFSCRHRPRARSPPPRPRRDARRREGRADARLHQAHRHGAARGRLRDGLLRGRGALRHARAAGELEGAARPGDRRASSTARTCSPASRSRRPSATAPRRISSRRSRWT